MSPPGSSLRAVDCVTGSSCTAVGQYDSADGVTRSLAEVGGPEAWQLLAVPAPSAPYSYASLGDVSCSAPGTCTAVGGYGRQSESAVRAMTAELDGSVAGSVEVTGPDGALADVAEVACWPTGGCAAVGTAYVSGGNLTLAASIKGLEVVFQQASLPPGSSSASLGGVAGDSPTTAVGIGYLGMPGQALGLLVTGIPR
jgi:hypothetical protein